MSISLIVHICFFKTVINNASEIFWLKWEFYTKQALHWPKVAGVMIFITCNIGCGSILLAVCDVFHR